MEQVLTAAVCIAVVANLWLFWRILSDLSDGVSVLLGEKKSPGRDRGRVNQNRLNE